MINPIHVNVWNQLSPYQQFDWTFRQTIHFEKHPEGGYVACRSNIMTGRGQTIELAQRADTQFMTEYKKRVGTEHDK